MTDQPERRSTGGEPGSTTAESLLQEGTATLITDSADGGKDKNMH